MKIPMSWLARYVDLTDITPQDLQEMLTLRGLEVSDVEEIYGEISGVVVGKVIEMKRHEDSDHLWVCQVDVGEEKSQIVTGAQNLSEGDIVPVATHGATLPGGIKIKRGKLRGVESCGMLCSGEELLLKEEDYPGAGVDGIMILKDEPTLGLDVKELLDLNEAVLEAEPTPNRADCLSIIGVAREAAAALGRELKLPKVLENGRLAEKHKTADFSVRVEDGELCPRYLGRAVKNIKIEPSPDWMQKCLRAAGLKPINNIVDITNFVMTEMGQPMHAFDLRCVKGGQIVVRQSKAGEKIVTLDEKERMLEEGMLVIADEERAVGIAGVMGGENSEITDDTQIVFFESAVFAGHSIRKTAKALGMNTDASSHFSKGVDIEGTKTALERACELVVELGAGEVQEEYADFVSCDLARRKLDIRCEKVNALASLELSPQQMADILNGLDIPTTVSGENLLVEVPHFRDDIEGEADIAEEVARMYGFWNIKPTLMRGELVRGQLSREQKQIDDIRNMLCGMGAYEITTYAFVGQQDYDLLTLPAEDELRTKSVRLRNPFGEDNALMRTTLATGMMRVLETNAKRKLPAFRLFEIGNVHLAGEGEGPLPKQKQMLCISTYGNTEDFYSLKGIIENLFKGLDSRELSCKAGGAAYLHPGRKALLQMAGREIGQMGELHPDVCKNYDIPMRCYMAEIDLDLLLPLCAQKVKQFVPLPRYPAVDRDLALIVDRDAESATLSAKMKKAGGKDLQRVILFDTYQGEHMPEGKKSLAFSLHFQSDHTLTEEEINKNMQNIILTAEKAGAQVRS